MEIIVGNSLLALWEQSLIILATILGDPSTFAIDPLFYTLAIIFSCVVLILQELYMNSTLVCSDIGIFLALALGSGVCTTVFVHAAVTRQLADLVTEPLYCCGILITGLGYTMYMSAPNCKPDADSSPLNPQPVNAFVHKEKGSKMII